jgi:hypothetical protein
VSDTGKVREASDLYYECADPARKISCASCEFKDYSLPGGLNTADSKSPSFSCELGFVRNNQIAVILITQMCAADHRL